MVEFAFMLPWQCCDSCDIYLLWFQVDSRFLRTSHCSTLYVIETWAFSDGSPVHFIIPFTQVNSVHNLNTSHIDVFIVAPFKDIVNVCWWNLCELGSTIPCVDIHHSSSLQFHTWFILLIFFLASCRAFGAIFQILILGFDSLYLRIFTSHCLWLRTGHRYF